jgi:hypothetical protein
MRCSSKKSNPHGSSSLPLRARASWLHGTVRPFDRPIHRASASVPRSRSLWRDVATCHPLRPPIPAAPPLPHRGGILHVRYDASHPADCSCRRTWLSAPRPAPPSSMRLVSECSGSSAPAAPSPGAQEREASLAGQAQAQLATARPHPTSSATRWLEPAVPRSTLRRTEGTKHMLQASVSSVSNVSEVCCKCFIRKLQMLIGMLHML